MKSKELAWLSSGALASALAEREMHFSGPTLQRYAREGRLPARLTPGGHYRFDLAAVLDVLDSKRSLPRPPAAGGAVELLAANREAIRAIVRRHRGERVFVFGSVARGEAGPDSDVDLLVEFDEGSSLFDLMHVEDEIAELLGQPVDVISMGALKARDADIRKEALPL